MSKRQSTPEDGGTLLAVPKLTRPAVDGSTRHLDLHLGDEARMGLTALHGALLVARATLRGRPGRYVRTRADAVRWLLEAAYAAAGEPSDG